jgi:hypothetical protein
MIYETIEAFDHGDLTASEAIRRLIDAVDAQRALNAEALELAERVKDFEASARAALWKITYQSGATHDRVRVVGARTVKEYDAKGIEAIIVELSATGQHDLSQRLAQCGKVKTTAGHVRIEKEKV